MECDVFVCCYNSNQPTVWSVMYLCVVIMVINLQYGDDVFVCCCFCV